MLSVVVEVPVEGKGLLGCNYSSGFALLIKKGSIALFVRYTIEDVDFGE